MNKLLCLLFLVLPFSNLVSFFHIIPMEIPLLITVLALPAFAKVDRLNLIDALAAIYVLIYFMSVLVGADNLYKSAAIYRHMALSPVLLYIVFRFGSRSLKDLERAMYFIVPGAVIQSLSLINSFIFFGGRDKHIFAITSLITSATIIAFALFIMLYGAQKKRTALRRMIRWTIILILFGGLFATYTRAASVGSILVIIFLAFNWSSRWRRNLLGKIMQGTIVGMLAMIFTGTVLFSEQDMDVHEKREISKSASRLISLDVYMADLKGRMAFWGFMTSAALENPILGRGAASRVVGESGGTRFHLGSAHNILISSLIVAGLPGLLIFLLLVWAAYRVYGITPERVIREQSIAKVLLPTVTVLLMVAITNDLSAGRVFIWFTVLALLSKLSNERVTATQMSS